MIIKIMTWNVNKRKDADGLWKKISEVGADIVLLQETTQEHYNKRIFEGVFDDKTGLGVYSRLPINMIKMDSPYRIMKGKVGLQGHELVFVNIHNYDKEKDGDYYVKLLGKTFASLEGFMKEEDIVIAGDFNLGIPCDKSDQEYEEKCRKILDINEMKAYPQAKIATYIHSNREMYLNDFVMVNKKHKTEVRVYPTDLSDHYPVVVEIEI